MDAPLELRPSDEQKVRLRNWLIELQIICNRYQLVLHTQDGEMSVIDAASGTTVGLGLAHQLDLRPDGTARVTAYDCEGGIHDGVWLTEGPHGLAEQRTHGRVHPSHPFREDMS